MEYQTVTMRDGKSYLRKTPYTYRQPTANQQKARDEFAGIAVDTFDKGGTTTEGNGGKPLCVTAAEIQKKMEPVGRKKRIINITLLDLYKLKLDMINKDIHNLILKDTEIRIVGERPVEIKV